MQKMLLGSPTLVFVTKNKNYFVIQCFMHNLIISNVLDEESDAKKQVGSKEKLAFAEFRSFISGPSNTEQVAGQTRKPASCLLPQHIMSRSVIALHL